jgi:hypothetical protein
LILDNAEAIGQDRGEDREDPGYAELFDGDIDEFLAADAGIFGDIAQLLDRQLLRLTAAEQAIMCWLAIEREWVSPADLHAEIVPATTKQ